MASLRTFLEQLPDDQFLTLSERDLPLDYFPTALVLALERQGRFPVLRLDHPAGFDTPVVANLFATRDRIARMAGVGPGQFYQAWTRALSHLLPPVMVADGPVQAVRQQAPHLDAGALPISRHFEEDAGRYIGSGILVCKDPDTGVRNLSFQRLQLKGPDRFGASLHSRGHIWQHLNRAAELGRDLEVAVVIGGHPALYLAAAAKVAMEVDEYDIAGALLGEPVELVKCQTLDLEVPAQAEYVLEGRLLADEHEDEGPFGEYTGYSTYRSTRNVFQLSAITHRADPLFLDLIPGYSNEHLLLARSPREAQVFLRLKEAIPGLVALHYPKSGTHFHAYVSIRKSAEGQARQTLMALFGLDPYVKFAVVVDDDIDVQNEQEVLWALATRFQADTDLFTVPKVLCNRLDPSSVDGMAAKMGMDATRPPGWEGERTRLPADAVERARAVIETL